VVRVTGDFRNRDLNNNIFVLGGGQGLRGVPSGALVGKNLLLANVEYRTRPFIIETVHVGFVLFYDVGTAYDVTPAPTHTLGMGLRILLPQFNTQVIRLDLGFILGSPDSALNLDRFSSTFGQVTQLPTSPDFFDDPL
jgi:outer membrane protein assembly factor BamA